MRAAGRRFDRLELSAPATELDEITTNTSRRHAERVCDLFERETTRLFVERVAKLRQTAVCSETALFSSAFRSARLLFRTRRRCRRPALHPMLTEIFNRILRSQRAF